MESDGGRASAQSNSSDGSDQTRGDRAIYHAGFDRRSQCSLAIAMLYSLLKPCRISTNSSERS